MSSYSGEDLMRWRCLEQFKDVLYEKQCFDIAKDLSTYSGEEQMRRSCIGLPTV